MFENITEDEKQELKKLLKQTGSNSKAEAIQAQDALAAALTLPLRQGVLVGDNIGNIFNATELDINARPEYPIDFFRPDNAGEFTAYTVPGHGKIPYRQIEGDYITVPTYDIANSIDWKLSYAQEARWDIISRALEVMEAGMVKKMNDDGWHTILAAGFDRNVVVADANAAAGQFTKRLISLAALVMRRNGGGNASSLNRAKLTHLYISPEGVEDMRNWTFSEVDQLTQREIYMSDVTAGSNVYGINILPLDEFGEGQEYQKYYTDVIAVGASNSGLASASDLEIAVGLDLSTNDSFVMPVRNPMTVFADDNLHREGKAGMYTKATIGFAVLNSSRSILVSY